ncbi:hypothetical protein [Pelagibius marinus]|uniref:hypothetical protein n=1 Tax=Pelagibius marinus TaxID=2762760 RepID=UPI00187319C0|nr:hypothetical protein [Pelagibius marinus]
MFRILFPRKQSRFTVPALAMMVLAGGVAAAPAAAEPPRPLRIQSQSADLLVQVNSHREYRRDGGYQSRPQWQQRRHHREGVKRPHHRRHIAKRDWRRHYRGYYAKRHDWRGQYRGHYAKRHDWRRPYRGHQAKRYDWRRHDNRSRRDWGHQARRNFFQ